MSNDKLIAPVPILAMRAPETAASLGVSERTVNAWEKAGLIPSIRIGGCVLYSVDALRKWLIEQSEKPTA